AGTLTISDVDSAATFVAQTNTAGSYGQFSIGTGGAWTYVANSAHNEFAAGTTYTDTFAVNSADGTLTSVTVQILGTNDAAVLSAGIANLTETNAALTTAGTLSISDVDSAATFVAQTNTAGSYGQFSIGTGGAWTYVANSAHNEFAAGTTYTDSFAVNSADGTLTSVTVHITGSNDTPVMTAGGSLSYTENQAATTINSALTVTDVDSSNLTGATVSITGNFATGQDVLAFTNQNGITGSYNAGTGVLTLTGTATVAQYQTALRSVTYSNSSDNPSTTARTISFQVDDGAAANHASNIATTTVTVSAVNDAPTTSGLAITETSISFVATDPDNATLSLQSPFAAAFGNPSITSGASTNLSPMEQGSVVSGTLQVKDGSVAASVVELYLGTSAGNNFAAGSSDTAIYGFGGTDNLSGGAGADWIFGGAGNDVIVGSVNDRLLDGGANTDTLNVSANFTSTSDAQIANIENVTLTTSGLTLNLGNQTEAFNINGSSGVDNISGGSGADTINGQAGNDTLTGNGGADQFRLRTNGGTDTITDYTVSTDKIGFLGGAVTGGVGFTTVGSSAGTALSAGDFQTRNSISNININDDNKIDLIDASSQTTSQITTGTGGGATNTYVIVFNSTTGKGEIWFDTNWSNTASRVQVATLNNVTSLAEVTAITASDIVVYDSTLGPAGVAGSPINMGLADALTRADVATVTISGLPAGWTLNQGAHNGDGTWTVDKNSLDTLTVTTAADFTGALVLPVTMTWTNVDGTVDSEVIRDNIEAYAPGSPIFALSADDNLTGSGGADLFVFAQPIGNNVIHSFDAAADKIDLIGFTGVNDFADVSIANDANGNAVLSISADQTITVNGVDAAALSGANLLFDVDPVTTNTGTITIADGAIMPFGGSIDNSGTIELGSTGSGTDLEILFRGATLTGGGQVVLSDSAHNVIFGGSADTVLTNADNTLSGAGQLGAGQMMLINSGLILANGVNAMVIDTGSNAVTNTGVLEASGSGGLVIESALVNSGSLWANDGNITVHGDASGAGSATISGSAMLEFGAASDQHVTFDTGAAGTLKLDVSAAFSGSVSGFAAGDKLDFGDVAFSANTQITYAANDTGTGGMLSVNDGAHVAQVAINGQYAAAGLQANAEGSGSELAYDAAAANHTMLGGLANDILVGGAGDDLFFGGLGNDTLNGGFGNDTFMFAAAGFGNDSIQGFDVDPAGGQDLLNIAGLGISSETFAANVSIAADGADTVIGIGMDSIRLVGVSSAGIDQADFILSA
ncbi:VCBS domain-containing protein, partial [Pseudomonas synxantha]